VTTTVGDRLAETLGGAGVSLVFGIDDPQALYAGLRKHSVRTVIVHDERSGAFMADGYSRASHRLSVCTGIGGPGATNLATGLFEAYCASVPVLAIVGEASSARPDQHAFQALSHESVFSSLTKAVVRLEHDGDPDVAIRHAITLAISGRPRPVLFLARDAHLWEADGRGGSGDAIEPNLLEYPRGRAAADAASLEVARQAIREAKRPAILAGGGVNIAEAHDELLRLAERFDIPVAVSVMGKGAFPETHPLALGVASSYTGGSIGNGVAASQCLCEADLVIVVGSDLDALTTSGGAWPSPAAKMIRIDSDAAELNSGPGIHLLADAREALRQLADGDCTQTRPAMPDRDWLSDIQDRVGSIRLAISAYDRSETPEGEVSPGRVVSEMQRHLNEGDAIVTDASYSSAWALDRVCQSWSGRFVFAPRGTGVLGWGLPAAIGVKLARPHSRVVCLTGDGGLHYSLAELETAVRLDLDVTVVLLNNRSFGFQRHSDIARQGADPGDLCFGKTVDYCELARAFGWQAARVSSFTELEDAYPAALTDGGPTLIEVSIGRDEIPPILKFDVLRQGIAASGFTPRGQGNALPSSAAR
jgi:acetolactate synthase-1/2/3 large subunit